MQINRRKSRKFIRKRQACGIKSRLLSHFEDVQGSFSVLSISFNIWLTARFWCSRPADKSCQRQYRQYVRQNMQVNSRNVSKERYGRRTDGKCLCKSEEQRSTHRTDWMPFSENHRG